MQSALRLASESEGPLQDIPSDWFGRPPRHRASYRLWLNKDILGFRFVAEKSAQCDMALRPGDFVEGLWEQDVAELFLMGPDGRYQELNLSPRGAWWCALFSGYRQRQNAFQAPSVQTRAGSETGRWWAELYLNVRDIPVLGEGGWQTARLHVASILNPDAPEYLCSGHHAGGEPDFHSAGNFQELTGP